MDMNRHYSRLWGKSRPGAAGIIYLAWHGPGKDEYRRRSWSAAQWRNFIERETEALRAELPGVQQIWMREDLFLCLPMSGDDGELQEERLLDLANRLKRDWEPSFRGVARSDMLAGMALHTGIAYMRANGQRLNSSWWYEGMKRALVHGQHLFATERSMKLRLFDQLTRKRMLYPVFQPIISLRDESVYGYEALSRFPANQWFPGPQQLFDFASAEGMVYVLDRLARERAIESSAGLSGGQKLFINLTAQIMDDPQFTPGQTLSLLADMGLSAHHVVFEITERSSIEDFQAAKRTLDHYRSQGFQIAIDDAGAGYSSLQSIVELQPDFIKIDRSLIRGIHADAVKGHIVHTFTEFASKMGSAIIAEGIETEEELSYIRDMGVPLAQGYHLGRPQEAIAGT
ncbi:EAL domain-containing protein [Paenibacillus methanolicus]|uniref:EAL domain-containing protein (Putative c-di-GMP-specific phosphodiesterase class I) n=1 Tax=Paenibacillus methanolicus TaxID=582686 RepID=A0A5S5C3Z7_9BACL|nr:EAL domain-containing protein [Paenibacillus methanolicus]TYP74155.1 EAL domain-containing protein (putative c-di-GMP-specific phosphodiesterase class I) [Paenibacillus methanolicus]